MSPRDVLSNGLASVVSKLGFPIAVGVVLLGSFVVQNERLVSNQIEVNRSNSEAIARQVQLTEDIRGIVKHHDEKEASQESLLVRILESIERRRPGG